MFPKLRRKGRSQLPDISNDLSSSTEESRDYVFQIISKARHEEFRKFCFNTIHIIIILRTWRAVHIVFILQYPKETKYWIQKFGLRHQLQITCSTK